MSTVHRLIRRLGADRQLCPTNLAIRAGMFRKHLMLNRGKSGMTTATLAAYLRELESVRKLNEEEEQNLLGALRAEPGAST